MVSILEWNKSASYILAIKLYVNRNLRSLSALVGSCMKNDKKRSEIKHAKRRALERYDVVLNDHDLQEIVHSVRTRQAELIDKQSNRVFRYWVSLPDQRRVPIVYDHKRSAVVTFLLEEHLNDDYIDDDFEF